LQSPKNDRSLKKKLISPFKKYNKTHSKTKKKCLEMKYLEGRGTKDTKMMNRIQELKERVPIVKRRFRRNQSIEKRKY
jgi:hypothetical protein